MSAQALNVSTAPSVCSSGHTGMAGTGALVTEPVELWRHLKPVLTFPFWRKIPTIQHTRGHQQQKRPRQQHRATTVERRQATAMKGQQLTTTTTMGTRVGPLEPGQARLMLMDGVLTTVWPPRPTPSVPVTCASAGRGRGAL